MKIEVVTGIRASGKTVYCVSKLGNKHTLVICENIRSKEYIKLYNEEVQFSIKNIDDVGKIIFSKHINKVIIDEFDFVKDFNLLIYLKSLLVDITLILHETMVIKTFNEKVIYFSR